MGRRYTAERLMKGMLDALRKEGIDRNFVENIRSTLTQIQNSFNPQDVKSIINGISQLTSGESLENIQGAVNNVRGITSGVLQMTSGDSLINIQNSVKGISKLVSEKNVENLSSLFSKLKWVAPTLGVSAAVGATALVGTVVGVFLINHKMKKLVGLTEKQVVLLERAVSLLEQQRVELVQINAYLEKANDLVRETNQLLQDQISIDAARNDFKAIKKSLSSSSPNFEVILGCCNNFFENYSLTMSEVIRRQYFPKVYFYKGVTLLVTHNTGAAIDSFDEALNFNDPESNLNSKFYRAIAYVQLDEFDLAMQSFREIERENETSESFIVRFSKLYTSNISVKYDGIAKFIQDYESGELVPEIMTSIVNKGFIYYQIGQLYRYLSLCNISEIVQSEARSWWRRKKITVIDERKKAFEKALGYICSQLLDLNIRYASDVTKLRYIELQLFIIEMLLTKNGWSQRNEAKGRLNDISVLRLMEGEDSYRPFKNISFLEGLETSKQINASRENLALADQLNSESRVYAPLSKHFLVNAGRRGEFSNGTTFFQLAEWHQSILSKMYYYHKAALCGCEDAKRIISDCYCFEREGKILSVKPKQVVRWLSEDESGENRVNKELASALYCTGMVYFLGSFGKVVDIPRAERLFLQSAELGSSYAMNMLGYLYNRGYLHINSEVSGQPRQEDIGKAIEYYEQAIQPKKPLENPLAKYNLIWLYCRDFPSEEGFKRARELYGDVCREGLVGVTLENVIESGRNKYHGRGEIIDRDRSFEYFQLAQLAPEGSQPMANFYLALTYLFGQFVTQDPEKAITYLSKPTQKEHPLSQCLRYSIFKAKRRKPLKAIPMSVKNEVFSNKIQPKLATNSNGVSILIFRKANNYLGYKIGSSQPDSDVAWSDDFEINPLENGKINKLNDFSVAISNDGIVFVTYATICEGKEKLYYSVGELQIDSKINWQTDRSNGSILRYYSKGKLPFVAINSRGRVIEIHKSENHQDLYYNVGVIEKNKSFSWKKLNTKLCSNSDLGMGVFVGENIIILRKITRTGQLEVGRTSITSSCSVDEPRSWVTIGKIRQGVIPSISRSSGRKFVIAYEHPDTEGYLMQVTGDVSSTGEVRLLNRDLQPYDFGRNPSITIDSQNQLIEAHELNGELSFYTSKYRF